MSKITENELYKIMAQPKYKNRIAIRVYKDGDAICYLSRTIYNSGHPDTALSCVKR